MYPFQTVLLVICILGSITFLLEFICFLCNLKYSCKNEAESEGYTLFEEIVSFFTILLEDLPMLSVFFGKLHIIYLFTMMTMIDPDKRYYKQNLITCIFCCVQQENKLKI